MSKKFAVFISGYGRGCIEIIKDYKFGLIKPELSLIISDNPNSKALEFAKECGIHHVVVKRDEYKSKVDFEKKIISLLIKNRIEFIFLAGWMNIIGTTLIKAFNNKIVNIHPSILPSFKGLNAIDQALSAGVKITGVTTHFVNESIDEGKIIQQKCVNVYVIDDVKTLDNRIFKAGTIITLETINNVFI